MSLINKLIKLIRFIAGLFKVHNQLGVFFKFKYLKINEKIIPYLVCHTINSGDIGVFAEGEKAEKILKTIFNCVSTWMGDITVRQFEAVREDLSIKKN